MALVCSVGSLCGYSLGLSGSDLDAYARDVDEICIESFHHGIEGEEEAEAIGEEKGWSGPKIEAAIRYAWADALLGRIAKLMADHFAEPLPFQACGKPTSGSERERIPTGQLLGMSR